MKISKTSEVLLSMLNDIDYVLSRSQTSLGWGRSVTDLRKIDVAKDRRSRYRILRDLEKQKIVELKKEGERLYARLTDHGFSEALKRKILTTGKELPSFEACLVVFDVPEDMKGVRNMFRRILKQARFYMVQRSVWETTRDVVNELDELVRLMNAEKYILVYRVMRKRH